MKETPTRSTISTFCRLKPSVHETRHYTSDSSITISDQTFTFSKVLDSDTTQDKVFETVAKPCLESVLNGYNATIFAYGQTGSGKTFTITGGSDSYGDRGLIPRTLQSIFKNGVGISVSYIEIYNENCVDLLNPMSRVMVTEDGVKGCRIVRVEDERQALNVLFEGDTNRNIASTPLNPSSSRSHCIFTIYVETVIDGKDVKSKLILVDLAGSERVWKTGVEGSLLKEAKYINLSLHYLEQVIIALDEGRNYVPYRNSVMTTVLKDSIGGNCKCVMIATLNLEVGFEGESISTCRFAERVQRIENLVSRCEVIDDKAVIKRLEEELKVLKKELAGSTILDEELTTEEIETVKSRVDGFLSGTIPELFYNDYRKTKLSFNILKSKISGGTVSGLGNQSISASDQSQIAHLKNLAKHRDNEINILISMINKLKSQSATQFPSSDVVSAESNIMDYDAMERKISQIPDTEPAYQSDIKESVIDMPDSTSTLTNSDPKPNSSEDKSQAFKEFLNTHPSYQTQTQSLKSLYTKAKSLGLHATTLKSNILDNPEDYGKIKEYKSVMGELRSIKSEIEILREVLTKAKERLLSDFEKWYKGVYLGGMNSITNRICYDDGEKRLETAFEKTTLQPTSKSSELVSRLSASTSQLSKDVEAFYKARDKLLSKSTR